MLISDEEKEKWLNRIKSVPSKIIPRYLENAENAKGFYSGAGKFLVDALRQGPRTGAQIAMTATGQKEYQPGAKGHTLSAVEDFLLGKEKIGNLQSRYQSSKQFSESLGLGKASMPLAGIGTVAGVALDVIPTPGSGGKKLAKEAGEGVIEGVGKEALEKATKAGLPKVKINMYKKGMEESIALIKSQKSAMSKAVNGGIEKSVLQIIDQKTGEKLYKVIPKGDLDKFIDVVDAGIAGIPIKGKVYHLTAKTPAQMETQGFIPAGIATTKEIPNVPRWIKDEFNRFFKGSKKNINL